MCGISGFCSFKHNFNESKELWQNILIKMRKSLAHRGQDNTGEFLKNNVGFSHTRLAIRDIKTGTQPITRIKNNYEYTIVYNGEIYNTEELRKDLIQKGYSPTTTSDTEIILICYMEYGNKCVDMLNGIFSFAIYDSLKNKLILFRDRSGIKPLFYSIINDTLIFASEIKALFEHPYISPKIDINGFREIIAIGPARTDGCGIFFNINELKQGCFAEFDYNGFREQPYWQLISAPHTDDYETTVEKVRYLVESAITMQMVSDVDICTFLSGGIDSSIVTAIAYKVMNKNNQVLNSFSFDFTDNEKYFKSNSFQPERDIDYVKKMLEIYPTNHTYLECDEENLINYLYDSVIAKDMPGMADVDASLLYFCKEVAKYNKVTLTGECADEIFAGYPWFHRDELRYCDTFPWTKDLSPRISFLNEDFIKELNIYEYVKERYEKTIRDVPTLEEESEFDKRQREISYLNLKWFMNTLLTRMDRTSMYSGLEARVPFADHRIIEYLWNVPYSFKCKNGVVKSLLRDAFKDIFPREILYRKKSPYPKTYNPKYEVILKNRFMDIINDKNSPITPYIDSEKIKNILKNNFDYGKPFFGQLMAFPQLIAYFIQLDFWLKYYRLS